MYLPNILVIVLSLTATILIFIDKSSAVFLPCRRCLTVEECDLPPPTLCIWGENRDFCKRRVCSKGPGERCSSVVDIGNCAEGMFCSTVSHTCVGCYIPTMQCTEDPK